MQERGKEMRSRRERERGKADGMGWDGTGVEFTHPASSTDLM